MGCFLIHSPYSPAVYNKFQEPSPTPLVDVTEGTFQAAFRKGRQLAHHCSLSHQQPFQAEEESHFSTLCSSRQHDPHPTEDNQGAVFKSWQQLCQ